MYQCTQISQFLKNSLDFTNDWHYPDALYGTDRIRQKNTTNCSLNFVFGVSSFKQRLSAWFQYILSHALRTYKCAHYLLRRKVGMQDFLTTKVLFSFFYATGRQDFR